MIATDTQVELKIKDKELGTGPLSRDDWWISTTDDSSNVSDTETQSQSGGAETQFEQIARNVRAIRKDTVRVTIDGEVKTLLQQWECVVIGTDEETVHCEMHDLTDADNSVEFAELLWSEFNDYDKPLLIEGAVFYWSIGHLRKQSGQVRRFSETRLRRMPRLSGAKRREISRKVELLNGLFQGKP